MPMEIFHIISRAENLVSNIQPRIARRPSVIA